MRLIGNILWLILGGLESALEYFAASLVLCLTIVGIPFALQTFKIALLMLWPFGARITTEELGTGCLIAIMNLVWLLLAGFWIFLTHILFGVLLSLTIIGIPFARCHFRLALFALAPFGKSVALDL